MDYGFKFEIGQVLRHVVAASRNKKSWSENYRCLVVERHLIECPGGVQRSYAVRCVAADGALGMSLVAANEIELVASQPFSDEEERQLSEREQQEFIARAEEREKRRTEAKEKADLLK